MIPVAAMSMYESYRPFYPVGLKTPKYYTPRGTMGKTLHVYSRSSIVFRCIVLICVCVCGGGVRYGSSNDQTKRNID